VSFAHGPARLIGVDCADCDFEWLLLSIDDRYSAPARANFQCYSLRSTAQYEYSTASELAAKEQQQKAFREIMTGIATMVRVL